MRDRHVIEIGDGGKRFEAGDELLLDAALAAGVAVPFSCRRGECGCCKVRVLAGRHRAEPYAALGTPYSLAANEMLLCQSHACGDMRIDIPGWSLETQALRFEATVLEKSALAADIMRLLLQPAPGQSPEIRPGQYMKFYLEDGSSRCFSVANLPRDDDGRLEFHIRRVRGGRFSHAMLDALQAGDRLSLEGGFGACTWQASGASALVLLATGTGYAGVKPILLAALADAGASSPVTLYWGGKEAGDFYDRAFLDALAARNARFRWFGVEGHVQDTAHGHRYDWPAARVYACGNPAMIAAVRAGCGEWGVASHELVTEAFVPSGASSAPMAPGSLDPVLERVGPRYSLDGMLAAREQSIRAVAQIAGKLRVGMTTAQALEMADRHLRDMGASHTWHPTYIRFGDDTVRTPRQGVRKQRALRERDIVVVDIGPVWDGYEGDFGDTFVFGDDRLHRACAQAARDVFSAARQAWKTGLTGRELYDFAQDEAMRGGWALERNLAGHRVSDFPHALFGPARLAEMDIVPGEAVWVLEIQLRHPELAIGAFYEDILIGLPGQ
ncbi:NAD(P)H dependent flavin oxidoreductase family protein [Herbaspirillum sp. WKF16]|uniref:NAD(P)H dependent flavin oxidoreductase family protein n=1 Tax=Herbaspirillum sp. WKF16 TaxID=3028312 RepID=UPI0023A92975|nr:NAD(P)H dependent flavin oxidoreductase family protein [Herbaspirillum sp. WKF16]WDZ96029.1 NAD(P)H dependent flavin oxidoreductase family protein [Herbaspirillum sp. WKF16]